MSETTRAIRLASRPQGAPTHENFELIEEAVPEPADGQVLVRNSYLSVDPYMRGRMRDAKSYVAPYEVGAVMEGGAVGQVIASRAEDLAEGTWVQSNLGWREHFVSTPEGLQALDPAEAPVQTAVGVLGTTGFTAWVGLVELGRPQEGETVYVSAAAGAVGSVVGQLAKARGLRVVGSAGTVEKVEWLVGDLGFDAAFDYHGDLRASLREHCPNGIDIYFDNVGGDHLAAALTRMNTFGRIPVCGAISTYNDEEAAPGPDGFGAVLVRRLEVHGFIVTDHFKRYRAFREEVAPLVRSGAVVNRETIVDGIEEMPGAFMGLLEGQNTGKMLVRVGPDPD